MPRPAPASVLRGGRKTAAAALGFSVPAVIREMGISAYQDPTHLFCMPNHLSPSQSTAHLMPVVTWHGRPLPRLLSESASDPVPAAAHPTMLSHRRDLIGPKSLPQGAPGEELRDDRPVGRHHARSHEEADVRMSERRQHEDLGPKVCRELLVQVPVVSCRFPVVAVSFALPPHEQKETTKAPSDRSRVFKKKG